MFVQVLAFTVTRYCIAWCSWTFARREHRSRRLRRVDLYFPQPPPTSAAHTAKQCRPSSHQQKLESPLGPVQLINAWTCAVRPHWLNTRNANTPVGIILKHIRSHDCQLSKRGAIKLQQSSLSARLFVAWPLWPDCKVVIYCSAARSRELSFEQPLCKAKRGIRLVLLTAQQSSIMQVSRLLAEPWQTMFLPANDKQAFYTNAEESDRPRLLPPPRASTPRTSHNSSTKTW